MDQREQQPLASFRFHGGRRFRGIRHAHELEEHRQAVIQFRIEKQHSARNFFPRLGRGILHLDVEIGTEQIENGQERHVFSVRRTVRFVDDDALRPAALGEFIAQAALAESGIADDAHNLAVAFRCSRERRFQHLHFVTAPRRSV